MDLKLATILFFCSIAGATNSALADNYGMMRVLTADRDLSDEEWNVAKIYFPNQPSRKELKSNQIDHITIIQRPKNEDRVDTLVFDKIGSNNVVLVSRQPRHWFLSDVIPCEKCLVVIFGTLERRESFLVRGPDTLFFEIGPEYGK